MPVAHELLRTAEAAVVELLLPVIKMPQLLLTFWSLNATQIRFEAYDECLHNFNFQTAVILFQSARSQSFYPNALATSFVFFCLSSEIIFALTHEGTSSRPLQSADSGKWISIAKKPEAKPSFMIRNI